MRVMIDTFGGLCNQMMDIRAAVSFCVRYKLCFTFRHASLREPCLTQWRDIPFSGLFDEQYFHDHLPTLYLPCPDPIPMEELVNAEGQHALALWGHPSDADLYQILVEKCESHPHTNPWILLRQFWCVFDWVYCLPMDPPSALHLTLLMDMIRESLLPPRYNFLHYRYEHDFTGFFNITCPRLDDLLHSIDFKEPDLPLYIGTDRTHLPTEFQELFRSSMILHKDTVLDTVKDLDLNYEEKAFLDYRIGLGAVEVYGHSQSSFSHWLNNMHHTRNYYNEMEK